MKQYEFGKWYPIESKPPFNEPVIARIVHENGEDPEIATIKFNKHDGFWHFYPCEFIRLSPTGDSSDDQFPTHWMPLPPPPTDVKEEL